MWGLHSPYDSPMRLQLPIGALALLASPTYAQQFVFTQSLPGGLQWTEGVEAADVDQDGDLDFFTANGEGLYNPSTKLRTGLIINRFEIAPLNFRDESLTRLGTKVSNGKNVNTADVDGDGWVDALISNGFATDPPFLYMNRGASQPGFYDEEGAARGLTTLFSSAGASFGDIDNDGDLDLVLGDTGPVFNGAPGGRPHVFLNDGNGNFVENLSAVSTVNKIGHLDVDLVDIDLDWDLDIYGTNRGNSPGGIHHLLLNNGNGQFSDSSAVIPNTSNNVYESDLADLDGDTDMDLFFLSLSGFNDGGMRNNVVGTGGLSFTAGASLGGDDDNEVSFIDYDMDSDLDVVIGSLGIREKMIRNDGPLNFVQLTNVITNVNDKTLDVSIGDMDNDGDYDLITVQGESTPASWDNKLYLNNGPKDNRPPVIQRTQGPQGATQMGPWVARAQIRDEVYDDGKNWVAGSASYRVDVGLIPGSNQTVEGLYSSGSQYRFEFQDTAGGMGTRLVYDLSFSDYVGNSSSTGEQIVPLLPCSFTSYGSGTPAHTLSLVGQGSGLLGSSISLQTSGAPDGTLFTGLALLRASLPFNGGLLLIDPASLLQLQPLTSSAGLASWSFSLPVNTSLVGVPFRFQSLAADGAQPGGFAFSNGLELVPCQ
jgi:FG-GAP-like repeat